MAKERGPLTTFVGTAKKYFFEFDPKSRGSSWLAIIFFCTAWPYLAFDIYRRYEATRDPLILGGAMVLMIGALYSFCQFFQKVRHVAKSASRRPRV